MSNSPRLFAIPLPLLSALGEYLTTKPYLEVNGFIRELQRLGEIPPPRSHGEPSGNDSVASNS